MMRVAGNAKTRTVRLGFAETSTRVLIFTNLRVGEWVDLPKWERRGAGGWECKNEGSKTRICQNEHPGAHFRKSEGWGMGKACQNETVKGAGGWACKNQGGKALICQNEHLGARFRKSESWRVAGPAKAGHTKTRGVGLGL